MAGYSLNPKRSAYTSGKNILASEHFKFVEGGATLDAAAIGAASLAPGTAIARNTTTGKYEVYSETTPGTLEPGFDEFHILNVDVEVDGVNDVVVGEVLREGSVYDAKLDASVTAAFKDETRHRFHYVKHI